jgi:hypothetical protein
MKSFKGLDTKSNKVILGLFSLLFIVTALHTSAIVDLSFKTQEVSQKGQVISINANNSGINDCIRVRHLYNEVRTYSGINGFSSSSNHFYFPSINFEIQNACPHPIHIVESSHITNPTFNTPQFELVSGKIQVRNTGSTVGEDVVLGQYSNGLPYQILEQLNCSNCPGFGPSATPSNAVFAPGSNEIRYYTIPASSTRNFNYNVFIPSDSASIVFPMRLVLNNLKWFKNQALSDNYIATKEILNYRIPSLLRDMFATSFVNLFAYCPCEDKSMSQEEMERMKKEMGLMFPSDPIMKEDVLLAPQKR